MNRLHAHILSGGLVLSPVLITAEELVRLSVDNSYVENESDPIADAASHLQSVADNLASWHLAAYLDLAYAATWALALLAITVVLARTRPVHAAVSGLLGLVSVLGVAFHWAFYYLPLASLAEAGDRDMAAHAASTFGDDMLLVVALLAYLLGTLLAVLAAGVGLWRARALPWWGALGFVIWLGYVVLGPEARFASVLNLALLLPFAVVARRLTPGKDSVPQVQPALI
ncbi:MAG TPA: hypothetical protein VKB55_03550 [Nocardioidaceae bacterium]|nr:hypothetical protein [Nocardioidaceae bacterium]